MSTAVDSAIHARGLVKRYGDLVAVDGIDLDATPGTCLGLLGPNGAGKTTTIEILEGLDDADAGEVRILGRRWSESEFEIRERIGVQLQETRLQEKLTVGETLRMFASLYARPRPSAEIMALVGLVEKRDARVGKLSGGQRQRLALGCALVGTPEILFLDEPTTGLDPQARRRVWEVVAEFKKSGGTVLLTTHYMDEAERLADDLVILDRGRVIARGTPSEIIRSLGAESIIELELLDEDAERVARDQLEAARALPGVESARLLAGVVTLTVTETRQALASTLQWIEDAGLATRDVRTHRPTLEDVFVAMTGKFLRDE